MPFHHFYHLPGVTDLGVQRLQAERVAAQGGTAWVHLHSRLDECSTDCQVYEPDKKEQ